MLPAPAGHLSAARRRYGTAMAPLPLPEGLADDVVRLRAFRESDAAAVFDACRDPLVRRFTLFPEPRHVGDTRAWIRGQAARRERGESLDLAVTAAGDDAPIGAVGLVRIAPEHRRAEAGYWIAPHARGRGRAAAALRLLSRWALAPPLDLVRVELQIDVENRGSQRTAQRAGFEREGVLRSYVEAKGRRWDVALYALVRGG